MGNLLKYEFRNSKNKVFQQIGIILSVSFILQLILNGVVRFALSDLEKSGVMVFVATISGLIVFAGLILIIVTGFMYYITLANILKKDIYYGQGYITFSIPKSGYQIIGAKILVSIFWLFILPIVTICVNALLGYIIWIMIPGIIKVDDFWNEISMFLKSPQFVQIIKNISLNSIFYYAVSWLVNSIFTILFMYACVIADYRIGRRKKDSSMWILYYIVGTFIYSFLMSFLLSPAMVTTTETVYGLNSTININTMSTEGQYISLGINFVMSILLYIFVCHNFENKIEK